MPQLINLSLVPFETVKSPFCFVAQALVFPKQCFKIEETVQAALSKFEDLFCLSVAQMAFPGSQTNIVNEVPEICNWQTLEPMEF